MLGDDVAVAGLAQSFEWFCCTEARLTPAPAHLSVHLVLTLLARLLVRAH